MASQPANPTDDAAAFVLHVVFLMPVYCAWCGGLVSEGDDPVALTARLTADIEAQIRRVPEQWVWMHDRYRERPKWEVKE